MKPLIVSFSQSNYMTGSCGTEKYIRELAAQYSKEGYEFLHFFSFSDPKVRKCVGVIYNDAFVGLYSHNKIVEIITYMEQVHDAYICCIHLQHLLNHRLEEIAEVISIFKVPVYLFVHDYYLMCHSYNLIDSGGLFCGEQEPCEDKCGNCSNWEKEILHKQVVNKFMQRCKSYLKSIIVPSKYVYRIMAKNFPEYADFLLIRPHLVCFGDTRYAKVGKTVRIAFAGEQTDKKGFEYFKNLVGDLKGSSCYEFYYLGNGKEVIKNIKNVYVSIAEQGSDAMREALKNNNISLVFLWPICPETYSYVYYEILSVGGYVITNANSGNIACMVEEYQNGTVFQNYQDVLTWLNDYKQVVEIIGEYRTTTGYKPERIMPNQELNGIVPGCREETKVRELHIGKRKLRKCRVLTYVYKRMRYGR